MIAPHNHLNGQGCPKCKRSKGEATIENILNELKIDFQSQKKFDSCKNKFWLPFDFYLEKYKLCIEFGKQHYESVEVFGGTKGFLATQTNDNIKSKWCILIIILIYWE